MTVGFSDKAYFITAHQLDNDPTGQQNWENW